VKWGGRRCALNVSVVIGDSETIPVLGGRCPWNVGVRCEAHAMKMRRRGVDVNEEKEKGGSG
jgi:hypothetical protein